MDYAGVSQFLYWAEANLSIIMASLAGSLISVIAREEKSLAKGFISFCSGVFVGWYLSLFLSLYVSVPREPLAALLAITGRDLVNHIITAGKNNPIDFIRSLLALRLTVGTAPPPPPPPPERKENSDG